MRSPRFFPGNLVDYWGRVMVNIELLSRKLNRLRLAACHIDNHLDQPVCLDDLADIACLSRFHFERVFAGYAGESPLARVRRLRLTQARKQIESGVQGSLLDLAFETGYATPAAFSRAYRRAFGLPPSAQCVAVPQKPESVTLEYLPARRIQYVPFAGQIDESLRPFDELRARAMAQGIPKEQRKGWAVHLDGDMHGWRGSAVLRAALLSDPLRVRIPGLDLGVLPAGYYAVFLLRGGYDAPPCAELARRIAMETGCCMQQGPILRSFDNSTYLPAHSEKRCKLYVPVSIPAGHDFLLLPANTAAV